MSTGDIIFGHAYMDDCFLVTEDNESMQALADILSQFCAAIGLKLNASKSYYTTTDPNPDLKITVYNPETNKCETTKRVPPTEPIRYLGVYFTLDLKWKAQADFIDLKIKNICEGIRRSPLSYSQSVVAANLLAGGLANFHFLIADFPRTTIREWDSKIINTLKRKLNIGTNAANIHFTLPCLAGKSHFVPLESLWDAIQIGEAGFIRLNDDDTLVGRLTRARLQNLADLRATPGCPLKNPTHSNMHRTTNHMAAVEDSLHNLGFTIDTDKMITPQPRTFDIPIQQAMSQQHFEAIQSGIAAKKAIFIGHFATDDGLYMISPLEARERNIISSKGGVNPTWYFRLRESICSPNSQLLLPHLTVSEAHSQSPPPQHKNSIATRQPLPNRKEEYSITTTKPIMTDTPQTAARITVSDGSTRKEGPFYCHSEFP